MPNLQVTVVPAPDLVVVRLTGEADASTVDRLTEGLVRAAGLGTGRVVVDVAGTRFRDSSGLQALTRFTAALAPTGRQCRVVGAPAATRRLVQAAGLADQLELDGPLAGDSPVRPLQHATTQPVPPLLPPLPVRRPTGARHQVVGARRVEEHPTRNGRLRNLARRWR